MPVSPIEIKVVHNIATEYPVNQITCSTTEDQAVSDGFPFMTIVSDKFDKHNRDQYRDPYKKVALPASTISEKTKCGTGVPNVYPVKERSHWKRLAITH
ncbi:conserved hypothetical protein [Pseudomonas sp. OF001]|nr:conserved hypothetical protein [Pseudomonas sp. OF001]